MGPEPFTSPLILVIALAVVAVASTFHYRGETRNPQIRFQRLMFGYLLVALACAGIAAVDGYIPRDEALSRWQVASEDYWSFLLRGFVFTFPRMSCLALAGVATIGLAVVSALGRRGLATVPFVVAASIPISAVAATMFGVVQTPAFRQFDSTLAYFVGTHTLLSLSFCIGAGLPWARQEAARGT